MPASSAGATARTLEAEKDGKPTASPASIVFLIRSLETGGAERQLAALARGLDRRHFSPRVITFYGGGALESELESAGVPVESLEKRGRWDLLGPLSRLRRRLRSLRPAVLHAFLTTGNLYALAARSAAPGARLVWGWRASAIDYRHYSIWFRITEALEVRLSRRTDLIVANAEAGRHDRVAQGAPANRIRVVPNGIDTTRFRPDAEARRRVREEWGLDGSTPLIGIMARLDPMKGHRVFLEAAAQALSRNPALHFVVLGSGSAERQANLREQASKLGLGDRVIWAGERRDANAVLAALDLHCSASLFGEGFSNTVAESMASGVPNVVSDVGDSAAILGDCGTVVPADDPEALAEGLLDLLARLDSESASLKASCRRRIEEHFSLEAMVERTAALYGALLDPAAGKA